MINFNHLKEAKVSYLKHGVRALYLSSILIFISFIAFIHAFIPFIFYDMASSLIKDLNKEIQQA